MKLSGPCKRQSLRQNSSFFAALASNIIRALPSCTTEKRGIQYARLCLGFSSRPGVGTNLGCAKLKSFENLSRLLLNTSGNFFCMVSRVVLGDAQTLATFVATPDFGSTPPPSAQKGEYPHPREKNAKISSA